MQLAAAGTSFAVLLLLIAEWRGSRLGVWLCKPLASCGFLLAAAIGGVSQSAYGRYVFAGLVLCACGDVLLIPRANGRAFLLGICAFALAHVAYACAFALQGLQVPTATGALAAMLLIVALVLRWLRPHLPRDLRLPVRGYMLVIAIMVGLAVAASAATGVWRGALGAGLFALSDLSVARERFVKPGFANLVWGLPLYYVAQWLLVWFAAAR